jgi:hypothetical protein
MLFILTAVLVIVLLLISTLACSSFLLTLLTVVAVAVAVFGFVVGMLLVGICLLSLKRKFKLVYK